MNLEGMTKKQLEKLIKDAQLAILAVEKKEMKEAKKAAEKAAAKYGFSLAELTDGAKAGRRKGAAKSPGVAKYANPDDPSQTWTGKGRQPAWYKAALEAGSDPAGLEI